MQTIGWIDATEKIDNKTPTKLYVSLYKIYSYINLSMFSLREMIE